MSKVTQEAITLVVADKNGISHVQFGEIEYKVKNGTFYDKKTGDDIIIRLEAMRIQELRITVAYGATNTGTDWREEHDVKGYIGRSMGPVKIPLLLYNRRTKGAGGMLTHCIVMIKYSNKNDGGVVYKHPNYDNINS